MTKPTPDPETCPCCSEPDYRSMYQQAMLVVKAAIADVWEAREEAGKWRAEANLCWSEADREIDRHIACISAVEADLRAARAQVQALEAERNQWRKTDAHRQAVWERTERAANQWREGAERQNQWMYALAEQIARSLGDVGSVGDALVLREQVEKLMAAHAETKRKLEVANQRADDSLCSVCNGNGVLTIPGGVTVCPRCRGKCWEPGV